MKYKRIILTFALIVGVAAISNPVAAGPFDGGPRMGPGPSFCGPGGLGMLHQVTRLANRLDLTDEQMQQIEDILDASKPEMERLTALLQEGRDAFHEAQQPPEFDEASARAFADAQAVIHTDLMVLGMKTRASIFSLLTPEQLNELKAMYEERGYRSERAGRRGKRR
ncbi:MAG: Spy/CpxP family protein refolding chaperone [Thermoanaerobaculales bacterium]|nr:Spy/CpxP family protein refolding chaperone [Thermoanaerobaculales bacterium]